MDIKKNSRSFLIKIKNESTKNMSQLSFYELKKIIDDEGVSTSQLSSWFNILLNSHFLSTECKESLRENINLDGNGNIEEEQLKTKKPTLAKADENLFEFDLKEFKKENRILIIAAREYFKQKNILLVKQPDFEVFVNGFDKGISFEKQIGLIRFFVDAGIFSKDVKSIDSTNNEDSKSNSDNELYNGPDCKLTDRTGQADSKSKDDEGDNSATTKSDLSEIKIKYKKIVNWLKKSVDKSGKVLTQDDVMEQLNNLGTKKNTVSIDEDDLGDFLIILKDEGIILDSVAPITVSISELNRDEYLQLFNKLEAVHKKSNKDFFSVDEVVDYLKGIVKESSYNTISEAEIDNLMSDVGFVSKLKKLGIVRYGDEAQEVGARCPICNKNLVVRTAKKTGKRFIGCSAFPKCRYIESKEKTEEILLNIKCHKEPDFSIKIMDSINENFDIDSSSKNELIKLVDSIVTLQNLMGKIYYNDVQRLINKIEIDIKESLLKFLLDEFNIDYHEENSYTINPEDAIEYPDDYIDDIEKYILNNIEELFETYGEIDDEDVLLNTLNYHDEIIECGTDFSKFLEKVKVKAYKKNNQMKMVKVKIIDAIMSIVTYLGYKSITSGDAIELLNNYGFDYLKNKTDSTLKRVLNAHSLETFGNEKSYNNNDSRYFWKSDSKTHTLIDRSSFLESIEGMTDKEIVEHINDLLSMAKIFSNKN